MPQKLVAEMVAAAAEAAATHASRTPSPAQVRGIGIRSWYRPYEEESSLGRLLGKRTATAATVDQKAEYDNVPTGNNYRCRGRLTMLVES